jgi:hypothetical protein
MSKVILLVGVPGVGKSTITRQLGDRYIIAEHDNFIGREADYAPAVARLAHGNDRPVVANTPFGMTDLVAALEVLGCQVEPVFVIERDEVVSARYQMREGRPIPKGHLSRQRTYAARARETGAFAGTADEVLQHLLARALDELEPGPEKDALVDRLLAVGGSKR